MRSLALALSALVVAAAFAGCSMAGGDESSTPPHTLEIRNERLEEVALNLRIVHESGEVVFDEAIVIAAGATETRPLGTLTGQFQVTGSSPGSNLSGAVLLMQPGSTLHVTVTDSGIVPSTTQGSAAGGDA